MNPFDPLRRPEAPEGRGLLDGVELVVLDFDGVIADSEVISLTTLQRSLAAFGVALTVSDVRRAFLGASLTTITDYVAQHSPDKTSRGFAAAWQTALYESFRTDLRPVPHLPALLACLEARGLQYCIASSGTYERIGVALQALQLSRQFEFIFSAEEVVQGKPAPDLFLHAARQMGVQPAHCLVIEDSPFGVQAASAAKMRSIGFVGGAHLEGIEATHSALLLQQGAERVVTSLLALADTSGPP